MMAATTLLCLAALWPAALQRALDGSAIWTMERHLAGSTRTLVSSGRVDCVAQSGIVWRVTAPFPSSVAMTRDAMVFADEEGARTRTLATLSHYADIRKRTDAFAAGDTRAFDGLFSLTATEQADGRWRIVLTPEVPDMRCLFTAIEISGAALPTNAILRMEGGASSVLRFRSVPRAP